MICSKCKREISRDDKFCGYCGSKANLKEDEDSYPRVPEEYRVEHVSRPKKQVRQKRSIIYLLFKNWKLTLFVSIALFIIWNIIFSDVFSTREFPELEGPKTTTFTWEYDGRQYLMKKTLYSPVLINSYAAPPRHPAMEVHGDWTNSSMGIAHTYFHGQSGSIPTSTTGAYTQLINLVQ